MNVYELRRDFPIFENAKRDNKELIYFDNAATTQRPKVVIESIKEFYENYNANIHRGIYKLSEKATELYEETKEKIKVFLNAESYEEIIYTRNTTESINLVAYSYTLNNINRGDNVVLSVMEHHSNLVPWQILSKIKGIELRFVKMNEEYEIDLEDLKSKIDSKTRLISVVHVSNAIGSINPIKDIVDIAHDKNIPVLVDGAQSAPHMEVDVKNLDIDFFAFSGHKMLGPFGIGVLYGKREYLEHMDPFLGGGDMIKTCSLRSCNYASLPYKFEAGTPNIAGAYALSKAVEYLERIGLRNVEKHERKLTKKLLRYMMNKEEIIIYGKETEKNRAGIISFNTKNLHSHDIATILDRENIAIRAGHHCAMPLMKYIGVEGTARVSFYLYNTEEEIERFIEVMEYILEVF